MHILAHLKRSVWGVIPGALLLLAGVGGYLSLWAQEPPVPAREHVVEIRNFEFEPAQLVVNPGDTVVWINRDVVPHTASSSSASWDSSRLREAESWYLVVRERGQQSYYCRFHPGMKGSFLVE